MVSVPAWKVEEEYWVLTAQGIKASDLTLLHAPDPSLVTPGSQGMLSHLPPCAVPPPSIPFLTSTLLPFLTCPTPTPPPHFIFLQESFPDFSSHHGLSEVPILVIFIIAQTQLPRGTQGLTMTCFRTFLLLPRQCPPQCLVHAESWWMHDLPSPAPLLCLQAQTRVRACWPCPSVPIGDTSLSPRLCKKNPSSPFMNCQPFLAESAKSLIILTSQFRSLFAWLFLQTPNTSWPRPHLQSQTLSIGCGKNRK